LGVPRASRNALFFVPAAWQEGPDAMAEDEPGRVPRGNANQPNHLQVTMGGKSFGLMTKDLIPVLLLVILGVGGYLLYTNVYQGIVDLERNHEKIEKVLYENQTRIVESIAAANSHRERQTDEIRRLLLTHEYNQTHAPEERLPLELPPPQGK